MTILVNHDLLAGRGCSFNLQRHDDVLVVIVVALNHENTTAHARITFRADDAFLDVNHATVNLLLHRVDARPMTDVHLLDRGLQVIELGGDSVRGRLIPKAKCGPQHVVLGLGQVASLVHCVVLACHLKGLLVLPICKHRSVHYILVKLVGFRLLVSFVDNFQI